MQAPEAKLTACPTQGTVATLRPCVGDKSGERGEEIVSGGVGIEDKEPNVGTAKWTT